MGSSTDRRRDKVLCFQDWLSIRPTETIISGKGGMWPVTLCVQRSWASPVTFLNSFKLVTFKDLTRFLLQYRRGSAWSPNKWLKRNQ